MKTKLSILAFLLLPALSFSASVVGTDSRDVCCNSPYCGAIDSYVCGAAGSWYQTDWNGYYCQAHSLVSVPSCPSGQVENPLHCNVCETPVVSPLSNYDNDPQGCSNAGGYFMSTGTEQVGGTSYGASFFGGAGIVIGGDIKSTTKCGTLSDLGGAIISQAVGLVPLLSRMFGSSALKMLANEKVILDTLPQLMNRSPAPKDFPDMHVGLPRLPPPGSPSMVPTISVKETPIPPSPNSTGVVGPSRAPNITADPVYTSVSDVFIPLKSSGDPVLDYSVVDRVNTINKFREPSPLLSDIVPNVGSTSLPVKETFDFSKILENTLEPVTITSVPVTTTKTTTYNGSDPIDTYVTTKVYPDGSQSSSTVKINTVSKIGTIESTTLAPTGETSSVFDNFVVTQYIGTLNNVPLSPPTGTTFIGTPPSSTIPTTVTNPDNISNQDPNTIINAKMPNYSFPASPSFVLFDTAYTNDMVSGVSDMFGNIRIQLSLAKTTFDDTKSLLNGSWTPPQFPAGSCGNSMAFDFHGRHVDFCPPITNFTSQYSPLFSSVISIAGTGLAIGIFIGGF
ncbi:MAG: hypothetical protein Q8R86_06195 [Sulfuricurvum sp.]|nr:hypothetical protein [Sulfuricurvum sp.]